MLSGVVSTRNSPFFVGRSSRSCVYVRFNSIDDSDIENLDESKFSRTRCYFFITEAGVTFLNSGNDLLTFWESRYEKSPTFSNIT